MPMILPGAARAEIHPDKVRRYLLDPTNPRSRGKPAIFFGLGYTLEAWHLLCDALLAHGRTGMVSDSEQEGGTTVYTVEGVLAGPNGRIRRLRSVWRVDPGADHPRFVTAFPAPRERRRR